MIGPPYECFQSPDSEWAGIGTEGTIESVNGNRIKLPQHLFDCTAHFKLGDEIAYKDSQNIYVVTYVDKDTLETRKKTRMEMLFGPSLGVTG